MDDIQFRKLLETLDLSWEGYRKVRKGVKKRLRRYIKKQGYSNFDTYMQEIHLNPRLKAECLRLMTVSISRFFRDQNLWQILEKEVFPALLKKEKDRIEIWSAGCACGEEVYSLTIVLKRFEDIFKTLPDFEILATDLNPVYLEKARIGVYPKSSLKETPPEWLGRYFEPLAQGNLFRIASFLRQNVTWKAHDLLSDPGQTTFDIIFLRNNLLTYYQEALKIPALCAIIDRLAPNGFLIIGSHEKLPPATPPLKAFKGHRYIFQKIDLSRR
ncbi:MAG: protein-glutamate O-methyltransferase CheR [Deltaproteobacteria bacterium]|nr:protein-glutamate O-methyltransferase CheR [Deltaproteobacteria bacterium]MBW2051500.1 protein-glutamate O-methyltransferase CheR [Deltaproteobacteria bacterium]MBW2140352.1 protein-glutamate O-methyltransferase CheR [Deltaproteobacteria bacterium]MBW2323723.1 protein-glutamate O-methyltransferase CheR [Deltaproteobacteria bacterium]